MENKNTIEKGYMILSIGQIKTLLAQSKINSMKYRGKICEASTVSLRIEIDSDEVYMSDGSKQCRIIEVR